MATFTNQASLSYNNTVTTSNVTTGEIVDVLSATKTAVADSYSAGDRVTYVVSIINSGAAPFTDLTVTDDLGGYSFGPTPTTVYPLSYVDGSILYYVNGVLQGDPTVNPGAPLSITGINVPANSNATLIYDATVTPYAPLAADSTINNSATITGTGINTPLVAQDSVEVSTQPRLTITKDLSPSSVTENSRVTYTFTIQNYSNAPAEAGDNVTLTDTFNPALSDLTVTFNGIPWASPANYTYDDGSGAFQTVAGQIRVPQATFDQNPDTGAWITTPGTAVLTVSGTI